MGWVWTRMIIITAKTRKEKEDVVLADDKHVSLGLTQRRGKKKRSIPDLSGRDSSMPANINEKIRKGWHESLQ